MQARIEPKKIPFMLVICFFILSEYCPGFEWVDTLHLKHYVLMAGVILLALVNLNRLRMTEELKRWLIIIVGLFGISLLMQVIHGEFRWFTLVQLYYMLMPFAFIYLMYNSIEVKDVDDIITATMVCGLISFFARTIIAGTLTFGNLLTMLNLKNLFVYSTSPMKESGLASYFVLMLIYFIYRRKKFRAAVCAVAAFLCYKRFAVLYMFMMVAFLWLFPRKKRVKKVFLWSAIVLFLALPFAAKLMCTDSFADWFYLQFGISFNKFTMTRFSIINTVVDANLTNYGLGTVTHFLEQRNMTGQLSMHNDILMIYMDCTIVGSYIFTQNYFYMCRNNYYSFLTMLFVFCQMFVTHCLGAGTITFWLLIYTLVFYYNRQAKASQTSAAAVPATVNCLRATA